MLQVMIPLKRQGAVNIVVTDCAEKIPPELMDECIEIPTFGPLTPLLTILPFHLLSYEIAKVLKRDPDRPRNLAKTVTVGQAYHSSTRRGTHVAIHFNLCCITVICYYCVCFFFQHKAHPHITTSLYTLS
eukprot:TRINITY_DN10634_c0_g1_i7.p2 TRINITY_DN10634_c0_g1~~TRINITY_DN10634_c0_g1_i7.p2  ORF type:complete len:130 (+),score=25.48 TRINITY_DN10634_c0_g1_i7:187-576(+)